MEKVYYDLHIHSCLSPCGDNDMTPNNIVNMALLKGLDLIAVTDHNSCGNSPAVATVMKRANSAHPVLYAREKGLLMLFGAEVETAEEVHVLCLFASLSEAMNFETALQPYRSDILNRKEIYGEQVIMDENDCVAEEEQLLLLFATLLSFYELFDLVERMGGAFVPAHVDREANSVLSNLGFIPAELPISTVEVSSGGISRGFLEEHPELLKNYRIITSSDAHDLGNIAEKDYFMELPERSEQAAIDWLKYGLLAK